MFIWSIGDALGIAVLLLLCFCSLFFWWPIAMRRWQCSHNGGVNETSSCDAICRQCGKNLGFIGTWRTRSDAAGEDARKE